MDDAPGWHAIDAALARIYGDTNPLHYAPPLPAVAGGTDFLDGVSAYPSEFGGRRHWHFVTYGFSELYAKESDDPELSGFGFELTLRVVDPASASAPPPWAISLLQNLARYVFRSGNPFAPGHHSTLNGPIALGRETRLVAAAFVADPELPAIDTPNGRLEFVQLVGITQDEYDAMRDWDTFGLLALVAERDRALLTDLTRRSYLEDAAFKARVDESTAREGSSMGAVFTVKGGLDLAATPPVLAVAANALEDLARAMRGPLAHGKTVTLIWGDGAATLSADGDTAASTEAVALSADDRAAIASLPVARGDYPLPSGRLIVRVLPVEIFDGTRTRVERVIG